MTLRWRQITEEQAREISTRRKAKFKLFAFNEIEQLTFPGHFGAYLFYTATGEGLTRGLYLLSTASAKALREAVTAQWGAYFAQGCELREGFEILPGFEDLVTPRSKKVLARLRDGAGPGGFSYTCTIHENYF